MEVLFKTYKASLTVEGVFVVPFVITVVISLMALCFRLHNRVKEHADSMHLTEYSRALINADADEREELVGAYADKVLSFGYMYDDAPVLEVGDDDYFGMRRETVKRLAAVVVTQKGRARKTE
ncbi:MAG: hypothetical protein ILP10_01670 [Lachnospiraceae bacterium]|nr:hypothetical protein [Lachnospiraceae bacterium]